MWRVVKSRGGDTWDCVVISDDWQGMAKVFGGEEIRRAVSSAAMWQEIASEHDSWWNARKIGEIVHYHNGFGQYVRGRIVWDVSEEFPNGRNAMIPTELVGNWRPYDLPHFNAAGNLVESHYVRKIREAETMQPNYSNMVEAVGVREGKGEDPRGKPAIDLTPPETDAGQQETARLFELRQNVIAMLTVSVSADKYGEALRKALQDARDLLVNANL